jgi:Arc/MetJ-type ribon-helix-helix transcriptional regulator
VLFGELVLKLNEYINRGLFKSKPELIRAGLRELFNNLEKKDMRNTRLKMMK